jgi:polyphosphate kinase 2
MKKFNKNELKLLSSNKGIRYLLSGNEIDYDEVIHRLQFEEKIVDLQAELIKFQNWVIENEKRVIILFEGREFAGKGNTINTCTEHLNPRSFTKVALNKPNENELGQWYFKRYVERLPEKGEIIFFDRSWYNRAVVEPVNGFCTSKEYARFMSEVNYFERMLISDGILLTKFYLDISKKTQEDRIKEVKASPLTRWQLSQVDLKAVELWDQYTKYTNKMLKKTNGKKNPWNVIESDDLKKSKNQVIQTILDKHPYKK